MSSVNPIKFDREGVEATLPPQSRSVRLVKLPLGTLKDMPSKAGGFQPGRLVINLAGEVQDAQGTYVQEFDPPLEIKVNYTPADYQFAQQNGKDLSLAFWNGSEWIPFTSEKHKFKLYPKSPASSGGYATVSIRSWGDPPIGWG